MTILFMGGEMGAFIPSDSSVQEGATAGRYDTSFSRCAIEVGGSNAYCETDSWTAADELWCHFAVTDATGSATSSAVKVFTLANAAGTDLVRVNINWASSTSHTFTIEYWNGASYTTAAGSFTMNVAAAVNHFDLHVDGNAGSTITLYVAGTERLAATGLTLTSVTNMTKARTYGRGNSYLAVSQVIVADEPTIGWRLATFYPNGAGATSSWTGAYTSIDETTYSDADFIVSAVADQVSTFTQTGPSMTGYTVKAVAVAARAKRGSSGPANLQLALRSAGTNYFSSTKSLSLGITANVGIWETDPATSAAWINTAIASLQPGVKSIT